MPERPTAAGGTTVVDLSEGMAGPLATMILADNGADVIKVERPGGDWARGAPAFHMWNRGKRSVVLDLHDAADRQVALDLVAGADVVVEGFRPGVADRLGIGYGAVASVAPDVVYCSIDGFGPVGHLAGTRGYEGVVAAATGRFIGLDHLNGAVPGQDRQAPIFTAPPTAAYGAAQLAVEGILAALLARGRTGVGGHVRTSLLEGATAFLMRQEMPRGAGRPTGVAPMSEATRRGIELCFMTAACRDGRYIQMCARQDHHFRNWLEAVGLAHVLGEARFAGAPLGLATAADVAALDAMVRARMRERTQAEWMSTFIEDYDVGADPFLTPPELLRHPDMVDNGRVVQIDDPVLGRTTQLGPLALLEATPSRIGVPAPLLDQHGEALRAEARAGRRRRAPSRPGPAGVEPAVRVGRELPLAGTTVLEVAYFIAGPLATGLLAEMGARVVKVEPPAGDPYRRTGLQSVKFLHGKESIGLDLKRPEGVAVLHQLISRSDVLVHSFRPGVPERLGLDLATAREANPRLVYVYAGSYGSRGPQRHRSAFHSTPTALCGGGILQAGRGNPPVDDSYPDPGSALGVATAILLGLCARERTGEGQYVETTMLTSTGYLLSRDLVVYDGMPPWSLPDRGQHGFEALYRLYRCASGWLFVAARGEQAWQDLARALGEPGWVDDERFASPEARARHDDDLAAEVGGVLRGRPAAHWAEVLGAADVAAVEVEEREFHEWLEAAGLLRPAQHPYYGAYWSPPPRVRFDGVPEREVRAAAVGEHTRALLAELGRSPGEVEELLASGVAVQAGARPAGSGPSLDLPV